MKTNNQPNSAKTQPEVSSESFIQTETDKFCETYQQGLNQAARAVLEQFIANRISDRMSEVERLAEMLAILDDPNYIIQLSLIESAKRISLKQRYEPPKRNEISYPTVSFDFSSAPTFANLYPVSGNDQKMLEAEPEEIPFE